MVRVGLHPVRIMESAIDTRIAFIAAWDATDVSLFVDPSILFIAEPFIAC